MGSGLNPTDGIVTVNIGESPYQAACAIVEVSSSKVACQVPDMQSQQQDVKAFLVDIYFSGQMERAELADGVTPEFTFSTAGTPSSGSTTPAQYSAQTEVEVAGTGFGTDSAAVSVFLRSSNQPASRRRRSIADRSVHSVI